MSRYTLISAVTGAVDFLLALRLLHAGFSSYFSLGVAIAVAGGADYLALEWWGFPGRKGGLSTRRLLGSGLVELGTYIIRVVVLWLWKRHLNDIEPTEHLVGLAVSYAVGFVFGYLARSRVVFKDDA
jgi:putative flippase GtrA